MSEQRIEVTAKQGKFIDSGAFETLYGGAAGGGKSHGQILDAYIFALKYKGSRQLVLRRTFPELERSLVRTSLEVYSREVCSYNESKHVWSFKNGSIIDFGYCDTENDVYKYQSAEYDIIRFDELTHFTEGMYIYLISRLRGVNNYPKQMKSTANPGGIGHSWVKARFIGIGPPDKLHEVEGHTRLFIPARATDNDFLMRDDPQYIDRLNELPDKQRRALKYGDWDIFDGQYFDEWKRDIHVCKAFEPPDYWKRYITLDYGLDMLAAYRIVVDEQRRAYVTGEVYKSGLIIPDAAKEIKILGEADMVLAPPDMWGRRQESGKSVADLFAEQRLYLTKTSNNRVAGWMAMKDYLKPFTDETGATRARLTVFENCLNLIRCIPEMQFDSKNPNDCATEPHEPTHGPDAIRGFCVYWTSGAQKPNEETNFPFKLEQNTNAVIGGEKYVTI